VYAPNAPPAYGRADCVCMQVAAMSAVRWWSRTTATTCRTCATLTRSVSMTTRRAATPAAATEASTETDDTAHASVSCYSHVCAA